MDDFQTILQSELEASGILNAYRSQLRAQIYTSIDSNSGCAPLQRTETSVIMQSQAGQICAELIRDFLEYFELDNTYSVFLPECHLPTEKRSFQFIADKLNINLQPGKPWIVQLIEKLESLEKRKPSNKSPNDSDSQIKSKLAPIRPQAKMQNQSMKNQVKNEIKNQIMGINRHPQISSDEDSDEDISDTDLAFLERGGLRQSIDTSSLGKDESLGSYVFE